MSCRPAKMDLMPYAWTQKGFRVSHTRSMHCRMLPAAVGRKMRMISRSGDLSHPGRTPSQSATTKQRRLPLRSPQLLMQSRKRPAGSRPSARRCSMRRPRARMTGRRQSRPQVHMRTLTAAIACMTLISYSADPHLPCWIPCNPSGCHLFIECLH